MSEVLDKIKKLLRVSEGAGATQTEIEQALAAAQRLATRNNIDLAQVDATEEIGPQGEPIVGETHIPDRAGGGKCELALPACSKFIHIILQRYFSVEVVTVSERVVVVDHYATKKILRIFGRESNVRIAVYVYGVLYHEFMRLWHENRRAHNTPMSSRMSFFYGVYTGLCSKLVEPAEMVKQVKLADTSVKCTALMIQSEADRVSAAVAMEHPRMKYIKHRIKDVDDIAYEKGTEAGKTVSIKSALT